MKNILNKLNRLIHLNELVGHFIHFLHPALLIFGLHFVHVSFEGAIIILILFYEVGFEMKFFDDVIEWNNKINVYLKKLSKRLKSKSKR